MSLRTALKNKKELKKGRSDGMNGKDEDKDSNVNEGISDGTDTDDIFSMMLNNEGNSLPSLVGTCL
jgi:hypothetical protein